MMWWRRRECVGGGLGRIRFVETEVRGDLLVVNIVSMTLTFLLTVVLRCRDVRRRTSHRLTHITRATTTTMSVRGTPRDGTCLSTVCSKGGGSVRVM